jgi:subtilase family serine protease
MSPHNRARHAAGAFRRAVAVCRAIVARAAITSAASARTALARTLVASTVVAGTVLGGTVVAGAAPAAAATRIGGTGVPGGGFIRPPCAVASARSEQCFLEYRPQTAVNRAISAGQAGSAASPRGWSPADLRAAYKLPAQRQSSQTVAVSIAYNTPGLAHYLAVYRAHYGLPPCTVASGCFRQVNQDGKASPLPPSGVNTGWDLEITLDVSMISVACPYCHIVVVEAKNDYDTNLASTDVTAARLGAQVISNSYGTQESGYALAERKAYDQPGHTIVASAGDLGFTAANFPADLSNVTAVGGTALARAASERGWSERVWNDFDGAGGSGCSAYVSKPAWQHDQACSMRTVADVSAIATNVPIYEPTYGGWVTVEGTSIAAPLIAGIYGLAGNGASVRPGSLYQHAGSFFDVTMGNNSYFEPAWLACGGDYLCVAKKGYDAPTGLGTPDGTGAF